MNRIKSNAVIFYYKYFINEFSSINCALKKTAFDRNIDQIQVQNTLTD